MQDRYAGDVGDFGKLGLLRQIAQSGLAIGVNWYLTPNETHNDDGKHIAYLTQPQFCGCDDALRASLQQIIKSDRSVRALEALNLLPEAKYYSALLLPPTADFCRQNWHHQALIELALSDIVFLDPDNGLLVKSVRPGSRKSNKYVFISEILDYYRAGQSVIFYNHRCRLQENVYLQRFAWLWTNPELNTAESKVLKFARGTTRDYFFIIQPRHQARIEATLERMLSSPWQRHFSVLDF